MTPDFSRGGAFVDDEYVPVAEARIPVLDWGFLHSDATCDVAHVWQGRSRDDTGTPRAGRRHAPHGAGIA